ncbi:MFS family permease [Friedmanniella endophytica]|uniref:MFS family permease n=1 Tax=Microlunatus kandeliicorticis TaxID=1759536 RepID=A0A7W3IUB7_9ACTN|nr:MFS transporter [Microlunatus kandeliicorticis]MBA8795426.1 MFS family permease [Microlunatus kandeliicorticis]
MTSDPTAAPRSPADSGRPGLLRFIPRAHPISWVMLAVTTGAVLITSIDRAILPAVLPGIQQEFRLDDAAGGFLVGLSFAGTAIGGLLIGVFGDSLGRGVRRAWAWAVAVAIVVVSSVLTAFSRTLGQLHVLRVVMGIGTGGMEPVNVTMVGEWWQKENRGFAVGTHHTGFPIGQFVGLLLIGATVAVSGWRGAFLFIPLIAVPIVVVQIVLARRRNLRAANTWMREHDLTPSLEENEVAGDRERHPLRSAAAAVRTALAERNVRLMVLANFLFLWAESGVTAFLTVQLTREAGMDLATAVTVSGASGITGWIGQIVWGTVSDHRGRKFSLGILAVGWAVAVAAMVLIHGPVSAWVILIAWGLVRNSPFPVMYAAIIDTVPEGASSGLGIMIGIGLGLSGLVAAPVAGVLVQHAGFVVHYLVIAAICLLALIPIRLLREPRTA